jgi:hypothetical protein
MIDNIKAGDLAWVMIEGVPTQVKVLFRYAGIASLDGFYDLVNANYLYANLDDINLPPSQKDTAIYYKEPNA